MLDALRRGTGSWAVKTLLALLIVSFAAWGIGDIFTGGSNPAVATIGDAKISSSEFSSSFQRQMRRFQESGSPITNEQARAFGLDRQVLTSLVTRALFNQHTADLGLGVSDARVAKEIQENPVFRNSFGDYDKYRLKQVLRSSGLSEKEFVSSVYGDIQRAQLVDLIEQVDRVSDTLIENLYRHQKQRRIVQLVIIPNDSAKLGTATEDALIKTHEENAAEFTSAEYRTVSFLALSPRDLMGEVQVNEEDLMAEYEERLPSYTVPERRTVDQLLLAEEDAALKAHDRLIKGIDFAALAQEVTGLSSSDIDLGALTREEFLSPELAAAVFSVAEGGFTAPVRSELGWHIFRVRKIAPGSRRSFESVREELAASLRMSRATDAIYDFANRMDDELASGQTLEETATTLSLRFVTLGALDREGKNRDGKKDALLPDTPVFLEQAFALEEGVDSGLIETPEGDYYVLRVDAIEPSALRPLESVRREVLDLWEQKERAAAAKALAETLMEEAEEPEMLRHLALERGYRVRNTQPLLRDASIPETALTRSQLSTLFTLQPGDITSGPSPSGNSYVIATLLNIVPADPASDGEGMSELRISVADEMPSDISFQYRDALEAAAGGVQIYQRAIDKFFDGAL